MKRTEHHISAVKLAFRRELTTRGVTLNGRPAAIMGAVCPFATVASLDGAHRAEWAWETVEAIVADGGQFRT